MSRTQELQLLAKQMGDTARGIKPEPTTVECKSCRQPRMRVGADGVCAKCLRGQQPQAGDPTPEPGSAPDVLFCKPCGRRCRSDGVTERPDGTIVHNACGVEVGADGPQSPPQAAKPAKGAAGRAKPAKASQGRRKRPARLVDAVLGELQAMQDVLDRFRRLTPESQAWVKARLGA